MEEVKEKQKKFGEGGGERKPLSEKSKSGERGLFNFLVARP